ncbi:MULTISPECIES: hypothetical protein [Methylotenera]|uniref:hypothetical protein n=1 Tax=Methylotenera TaxID=359407 RepID=UPI000360DC7C|nr:MULTISPECIES: hypothetical protein [Methylotenera]
MNHLIITSAAIALLSLTACNKPAPANLPDEPTLVPTPESSEHSSGATGVPHQSGDEGIDANTRTDTEKSGDEEIKIHPTEPKGDTNIIIPPPEANMPPEIVPEKH